MELRLFAFGTWQAARLRPACASPQFNPGRSKIKGVRYRTPTWTGRDKSSSSQFAIFETFD